MFLTLIHVAFGSLTEAAESEFVLGPYDTRKIADDAGTEFYNEASSKAPIFEHEMFHTVVEIPNPPTTDIAKEAMKVVEAYK